MDKTLVKRKRLYVFHTHLLSFVNSHKFVMENPELLIKKL
jgi:hypothetical protein